jgi:tetratricopeptide (TPR) repeat protein
MKPTRALLAFLIVLLVVPALADDADDREELELARQQAFRSGFTTIVESLNLGTFDLLVSSINREQFIDRIFGLRLISQTVQRDFRENMQTQFADLIKSGFAVSEDGVKATLLGIESRADRGRAVVRFDLPELQFGYHEYELILDKKNRVIVVDWVDFLRGEGFTDGVGVSLTIALPSKQAMRKLIDYKNVKDSDLFQFTELLKAARDRRADRYIDIINNLNPEMQRQRIVVLTGVQLTKTVKSRRMMRTALIQMANHFPEEPLYSLMLLDYYVPSKMYEEAVAALRRTYEQFDFDDAAMEARLSAIVLVMGNSADASALADRAIELEPGLELGWWSALRARVALSNFAGAAEALQQLEQHHGHSLGPEALERDKSFAALLASDEFKTWAASR